MDYLYLCVNSASFSSVTSREDCWINSTYFLRPSGALKPIEALQAGDQVCAANGQVLQVAKAELLEKEKRARPHEHGVVTSSHKARQMKK